MKWWSRPDPHVDEMPPERFEIVRAGDVRRQSRLHTDDDIAMTGDGAPRQGHVGAIEVV